MKIEVKIPEESAKRIGVVNRIPKESALKLVGTNGVGKTLTAKLLCSIAGHTVWEKKEQIESLREFLPTFMVEIDIENEKDIEFQVHCNLSDWEYDSVNRVITPDSIGTVKKNGVESNIEELRKHFHCMLVNGNEDISRQIEFVASSFLERVYGYFAKKSNALEDFLHYIEVLTELLSEEGDLESLVEKSKELEEILERDVEISPDDTRLLRDLFLGLKRTKFDFTQDVSEFEVFKKHIEKNREGSRSERDDIIANITSLKKELSSSATRRKRFEVFSKKLHAAKDKLRELIPPLDIDEFPDENCVFQRQSDLQKRKDEAMDEEKLLKIQRAREGILDKMRHSIRSERGRYNLRSTNFVLLFSRGFEDDISIEEFRDWMYFSVDKGEEKLEYLPRSSEIEEELEEIDNQMELLAEHQEFLKTQKKLIEERDYCQGELQAITEAHGLDESLVTQMEERDAIESQFTMYDVVWSQLGDVKQTAVEFWNSRYRSGEVTVSDFFEEIQRYYSRHAAMEDSKKKVEEAEGMYSSRWKSHLESTPMDVPSWLSKGFIDQNYGYLEKCHNALVQLTESQMKNVIIRDAEYAVDFVLKRRRKIKEELETYCRELNKSISEKIALLLNEKPFIQYMFSGASVTAVDAYNEKIYLEKNGEALSPRFITDFSSGERAFGYSFSTIMYLFQESQQYEDRHDLLFLDEFGALLSIDRMNFLVDELGRLQEMEGWPSKYVLVFPYKGEFNDNPELEEEIRSIGYVYRHP